MKVFITGGAGYIGGTVARILLAAGHEVAIYDNFRHSTRMTIPPGAKLFEGDLQDTDRLRQALSDGGAHYDGVMHFAGLIEVGQSVTEPELYFHNNIAGTISLIEAMVATRHGRLIFSSSAAVYGEPLKTPIVEDAATIPTNPYGETKLEIERMLRWSAGAHGLRYAALRYFNVAGAIPGYGESHEPETHIIPLILDAALGLRENIAIFGKDYPTRDGTCLRDYVHVEDLTRAHLLALDAINKNDPGPAGLIYNLGNGQGFTVKEMVDSARRVTGAAIPTVSKPRRAGDPAVLLADSGKIKKELGWEPKFDSIDAIMASAWEWHKVRRRRA
jgi:UDP-glucose 4-epimerase